jgi:hypothetical protein
MRPQNLQQRSFFGMIHISSLMTVVVFGGVARAQTQSAARASITIDTQKVENRISPMFYGQFMEFMYEDIKGGLYAELLRDRSFEEPANPIGLPRDWERDPDDRNDDTALKFHWDDSLFYPPSRSWRDRPLRTRCASRSPRGTASGVAFIKVGSRSGRALTIGDICGCARRNLKAT